MNVKHLDHLNLTVRNLDESRGWYAKLFGFECVEEGVRGGLRWGILKAGEAMLCIYENPSREFYDGDRLQKYRLHGVNHFALRITDRDEWESRVKAHGVAVQYGGAYEYPHSTSWYINDPTGYEIEVVLWHEDRIRF